jgi:hypothetical protein
MFDLGITSVQWSFVFNAWMVFLTLPNGKRHLVYC